MSKIETFQEFLATESAQLSLGSFVVHMGFAIILSIVLSHIYVKYGQSLSNRRQFASLFVIITMTTMLVITVVKSSLALSLGLVGALSIVRFRTAIKEPEELCYLFLSIGIGLGLGAGQLVLTLVAFPIFVAVIVTKGRFNIKAQNQNLFLSVASDSQQHASLSEIIDTLNESCDALDLRRYDESEQSCEATFQVEFNDITKVQTSLSRLRDRDSSIRILFVDNKQMAA